MVTTEVLVLSVILMRTLHRRSSPPGPAASAAPQSRRPGGCGWSADWTLCCESRCESRLPRGGSGSPAAQSHPEQFEFATAKAAGQHSVSSATDFVTTCRPDQATEPFSETMARLHNEGGLTISFVDLACWANPIAVHKRERAVRRARDDGSPSSGARRPSARRCPPLDHGTPAPGTPSARTAWRQLC